MNGKELKVAELELKFGGTPRMVNVFGVFRYKPNNGLYVIYADVGTTYDYICYGATHIKNDSILSMSSNKKEDQDAIKEYIFKVTSGEKLDNFEMIPLDNIKEIEIISSKNFEIKKEVLNSLIDKTIPKKEMTEEEKSNLEKQNNKKKSPVKTIVLVFLLLIIAGYGYMYFIVGDNNKGAVKTIYCKRSYNHQELNNVTVDEEKKYIFDNSDKLAKLEEKTTYKFNTEDTYLDFINKSLYYNYMPEKNNDTTGDYIIDNDNKKFITNAKTIIDESYGESVEYEEILSINKRDNYICEEKIEK
ncbi:MAG: hypothetical protein IKF19_03825 [Bacilli bacterium]|nr:hypothetical protein [Bacilli bacterium]